MNLQTRTESARINAKVAVLNRIVTLAGNFATRSVFIKCLGTEYLGAGGMFGNVFAVLSLFELGFGEAVSQAMYKPLANGDRAIARALVEYYSKVYKCIALITLGGSFAVMPFLPKIFPDIVKIESYRAVYLLFVFHQTVSFMFAPKRSLVACDRRMYVLGLARTVTAVCTAVSQILWLINGGSYIGYVFIRIVLLAADGVLIEAYAEKKYGFDEKPTKNVDISPQKKQITKSTKALAVHRIGGIINNSTDSILLSSRLGLAQMGVFSNYSLIINSIGSFISIAVNSASASVGNLSADENPEKSESVLTRLCFANFFLLTNCSAVLLCTINPIISLWIGEKMCFSSAETAVIIACFYMSYIRDPVQVFLHSYGVFASTKYIPLLRGVLNLILSYILVLQYGVAGVFGGTLISTVAVPFFSEPYMLFRHGFGISCRRFVSKYIGNVATSFIACTLSFAVCRTITAIDPASVALRAILAFSATNLVILLRYSRTPEFYDLKKLLFSRINTTKKGKP